MVRAYLAGAASSTPSARSGCGHRSTRLPARSRSAPHADRCPSGSADCTDGFWSSAQCSPSECGPGTWKAQQLISCSQPHCAEHRIMLQYTLVGLTQQKNCSCQNSKNTPTFFTKLRFREKVCLNSHAVMPQNYTQCLVECVFPKWTFLQYNKVFHYKRNQSGQPQTITYKVSCCLIHLKTSASVSACVNKWNGLLLIFKGMFCHRVRAKRWVVLIGFADYSGFVIKTHLEIRPDTLEGWRTLTGHYTQYRF